MTQTQTGYVGQPVARREGADLVRGAGHFVADVALHDPLEVAFLRAEEIGTGLSLAGMDDARAVAGVHAIHVAADLPAMAPLPVNPVLKMRTQPAFPVLAQDSVQSVGQPLAAVLSQTQTAALDAVGMLWAECGDDPDNSAPAPLAEGRWRAGDPEAAFADAAHVVEVALHHPVLAPSPMETRGIAVAFDSDRNAVTIWQSTQTPHRTRTHLAEMLALDPDRIRVIARDVGGAFGMKGSLYPEEVFAVWAAFHHRRDIRWIATRSEDFLSATHGRGLQSSGRLALDATGKFLALKARIDAPLGYWVPNSGLIPAWNAARILPGAYDIPAVDISTLAHATARPAHGIYRGAGRPEAAALLERLVDRAATVSGIDPIEIRRRNLPPPTALPRKTPTGNLLDSGDYGAALALLAARADLEGMRAARDRRRLAGELVGLGLGFYLEPSGEGWESARVTCDGATATVASGSSAQGQSRVTAYSQIAAEALNLPITAVTVTCGDTQTCPPGIGALASRSTAIGGSAVMAACRATRTRLEDGEPGPVTVETRYETDGQAWGYGAYAALVSIDRDTGEVTLERLDCADDTGSIVNPDLVRGQILGGIAQGLGEALLEEVRFDDDGQLLTGSFMDYAMPRAADMPAVSIHTMQTPSPLNILGAKGVGEAGTIGAPVAILNAALDALRPLGVHDLQMPLTPCRVWQAMQNARKETSK